MWLSQRVFRDNSAPAGLSQGVVTVAGAAPAVLTDREERELSVLSPGGYLWRPGLGDRVLLSREGGGCVLGKIQQPADLAPGEIRIVSGGASIALLPSGEIHLTGDIYLNGKKWEVAE